MIASCGIPLAVTGATSAAARRDDRWPGRPPPLAPKSDALSGVGGSSACWAAC
jgi:hypothetical protein